MNHRDFDFADGLSATFIHAVNFADALGAEPCAEFGHGDDVRLELLGERDGVADVVGMAVRKQHDDRRAVGFFSASGQEGLPASQGSKKTDLPDGVVT